MKMLLTTIAVLIMIGVPKDVAGKPISLSRYMLQECYHKLISISTFIAIQIGGGYSHGSNIVNKPPIAQLPINGYTGKSII